MMDNALMLRTAVTALYIVTIGLMKPLTTAFQIHAKKYSIDVHTVRALIKKPNVMIKPIVSTIPTKCQYDVRPFLVPHLSRAIVKHGNSNVKAKSA